MLRELSLTLKAAAKNPQVRVIVIAGAGTGFSAGHDLREMSRHEDESTEHQRVRIKAIFDQCAALMMCIVYSPKAIIASVQGTATAAGCQLVSACDLAIASDSATFCTPDVNIGGFAPPR
jgi:enoyl-CoA hydratase/carnithine racemase